MSRIRSSLAMSLAALLVAACASSKLSVDDEARIKNVAIVSLVPERATFTKIGVTVFNNDQADIDLGGRADQTVESIARDRISKARPNWTIRPISYDRAELLKRLQGFGLIMARDEEKIQQDLAALVRDNGLDALVLVVPENADSHGIEGLGVWMRVGLARIGVVYVHSRVDVEVIGPEGRTLALAVRGSESLKEIDPKVFGMVPAFRENIRPELIGRLSDEIVGELAKTLNAEFDQLAL